MVNLLGKFTTVGNITKVTTDDEFIVHFRDNLLGHYRSLLIIFAHLCWFPSQITKLQLLTVLQMTIRLDHVISH